MFKTYSELVGQKTKPERISGKAVKMVVPNQSMPIREILVRYASGQAVGGAKAHYYDQLEDFDQTDATLDPDFDLSDYSRIKNELDEKRFYSKKKTPPASAQGDEAGAHGSSAANQPSGASSAASSNQGNLAAQEPKAPSAESAQGVEKQTIS